MSEPVEEHILNFCSLARFSLQIWKRAIDFTLSNGSFPLFALARVWFAYFLSQQRGARSVCDYVDFL